MIKVESQSFSFDGYDIKEALYRNIDSVKYIITILTGYTTYLGVTGFDYKAFLLALGLGVATLAGKLVTDAVEFYFKNVPLVYKSK